MEKFAQNRNIEQVKTPPGHPAANNVETVMTHLVKAMKTGNMQNLPEQKTPSTFLTSYRGNPHVSIGVPPTHVLLRDGYGNNFSHQQTQDDKIREARQTDNDIKKER